ncbi:MAG: hypothetical protein AAF747_11820 [Planctomycetota bacterium]
MDWTSPPPDWPRMALFALVLPIAIVLLGLGVRALLARVLAKPDGSAPAWLAVLPALSFAAAFVPAEYGVRGWPISWFPWPPNGADRGLFVAIGIALPLALASLRFVPGLGRYALIGAASAYGFVAATVRLVSNEQVSLPVYVAIAIAIAIAGGIVAHALATTERIARSGSVVISALPAFMLSYPVLLVLAYTEPVSRHVATLGAIVGTATAFALLIEKQRIEAASWGVVLALLAYMLSTAAVWDELPIIAAVLIFISPAAIYVGNARELRRAPSWVRCGARVIVVSLVVAAAFWPALENWQAIESQRADDPYADLYDE